MILRTIHLLTAVVWVGSMIFFTFVVMPALRKSLPPPQRQELLRVIGRRYRLVGWTSIVILLITGSLLAWNQGVEWGSVFGWVLSLKLALVGTMLVLTALHDFVLGPRPLDMARDAVAPSQGKERQRRVVVYLARVNLLVVVGILLCGVWLTMV